MPVPVAELLPERLTLEALRDAAAPCQACDLWERATQTVFGEGEARARVILAGEQPGDREDRQGRPFVGPAGRLLDQALEEAGVDRSLVYITNVDSRLGPTPITVHPSSILRAPDEESRRSAPAAFVDDLRKLRTYLSPGR